MTGDETMTVMVGGLGRSVVTVVSKSIVKRKIHYFFSNFINICTHMNDRRKDQILSMDIHWSFTIFMSVLVFSHWAQISATFRE